MIKAYNDIQESNVSGKIIDQHHEETKAYNLEQETILEENESLIQKNQQLENLEQVNQTESMERQAEKEVLEDGNFKEMFIQAQDQLTKKDLIITQKDKQLSDTVLQLSEKDQQLSESLKKIEKLEALIKEI